MKVRLWGTRGSLATPGPDAVRYGGNTSCVEVRADDGSLLVLDAGTGIRPLGDSLAADLPRADVLLTHFHMDHIQGLGFFAPLFRKGLPVSIWGPSAPGHSLRASLTRYLSPPMFPVSLRDLDCELTLHDVLPLERFCIGCFEIESALVCHPGPTVGYRIRADGATLAYLPDHEPALGVRDFPGDPEWISGIALCEGVDLLIHDSQFSARQYCERIGWGHSSIPQAIAFARTAGVKRLVTFHHDPAHSDAELDRLYDEVRAEGELPFELIPAREGAVFEL